MTFQQQHRAGLGYGAIHPADPDGRARGRRRVRVGQGQMPAAFIAGMLHHFAEFGEGLRCQRFGDDATRQARGVSLHAADTPACARTRRTAPRCAVMVARARSASPACSACTMARCSARACTARCDRRSTLHRRARRRVGDHRGHGLVAAIGGHQLVHLVVRGPGRFAPGRAVAHHVFQPRLDGGQLVAGNPAGRHGGGLAFQQLADLQQLQQFGHAEGMDHHGAIG